jgi:superfamily II DNA or RNA helicase
MKELKTLYDYQSRGVNGILDCFKRFIKHVFLNSPTGSGKTVMFSHIAKKATEKGKRVLIVTDRIELMGQTGGTIEGFGLNPFYIRDGTKFLNFKSNIYIAMCLTLKNRLKIPMWRDWLENSIDLIIIDEAHRQEFNYLFEEGYLKNKRVIGFSATGRRSGKQRQLGLDYEEMIETISVHELVKRDYLVPEDYTGIDPPDISDVKIDKKNGDYSESEMFKKFNTPTLYSGVVKNWIETAENTKTIVFCVNIEHCIQTCEEFQKRGIDARFIVSKMGLPKEPEKDAKQGIWVRYEEKMRLYELYKEKHALWSGERRSIVDGFKRGDFPVLINAGILTTGFDCPSIETVVVNRATMSLTLWYQMIGRGSRIFKGKTHFNLLDFGGNAERLGHYTEPQHWSLWHDDTSTGEGVAPIKLCGCDAEGNPRTDKNGRQGCKRMILAAYMICPFCGFKYDKKVIKEAELQPVAYNYETNRVVAVKRLKDMDNTELYDYYKMKGHKPPWLWRQLYFRGGADLINEIGELKGWKKGTIKKAVDYVSVV